MLNLATVHPRVAALNPLNSTSLLTGLGTFSVFLGCSPRPSVDCGGVGVGVGVVIFADFVPQKPILVPVDQIFLVGAVPIHLATDAQTILAMDLYRSTAVGGVRAHPQVQLGFRLGFN